MQAPTLVLTKDTREMCSVGSHSAIVALANHAAADVDATGPRQFGELPCTTLVLRPRTVAEVLETMIQIGFMSGVEKRAISLVDDLRTRIRVVTGQVSCG